MPTILLTLTLIANGPPLGLHPDNPHYFQFRGQPTVLITSGEHYGAVLNLGFDDLPYLDELHARGLNLTRTFSGTYREVPGSFDIQSNTLAPAAGQYLAPWPQKDGKFDLDHFDDAYFARLKAFVAAASERGIVVEYVLFCPLYNEQLWGANPMNAKNNTNGVGGCPSTEVYTLKHTDLLDRQLVFVRKAVTELNGFDNVYFEICNEPYFGGVTLDWQRRVADEIVATEKGLPNKHLIAQNIANDKAKVDDPNPNVSIFNFHYAAPPVTVGMNWGLNRPIAFDETGFKGNADATYRRQAWEFLLAGGAVFSNLDYSFTVDHPDGTAEVKAPTPGGGSRALRKQLSVMKKFIESFEFTKMKPDTSAVKVVEPKGVQAWALSEPGKQYAIYIGQGPHIRVSVTLPPGSYAFECLDAASGEFRQQGEFEVKERMPNKLELAIDAADAAVRIKAKGADAQTGVPRLKVSENHRFLVREDGSPFFYLGDTAWELFHRLDRDEADLYLRDRASKGFTVIQAVALAEHNGLRGGNRNGQVPLIDNDPTKPNEAYFKDVDWIVNRARELGLFIGMLPTWGDKVNKKWGGGPEIFTPENARAYGEFLGKRYRDQPIIWILGGDRPVENDRHRAIWNAMAEGLHAGDEGRHLITYHPAGGATSAQWFAGTPWLDFNMLQSGHGYNHDNYNRIAADYARTPVKPCLDGEPGYEDHPAEFNPKNGYMTDYDVRKFAYWALFAGAHGHTYGCHDIWQFWDKNRKPISWARTPWREALNLPGSTQVGTARRLIESRPFLTRIPDQELIVGDAGKGGEHVQATRDAGGSYAFVYVPVSKSVMVNTSKLSGKELVAWWFDPRTGKAAEISRSPRGDQREFTPPAGGPDWVLVLDDASRSFPPPGQK